MAFVGSAFIGFYEFEFGIEYYLEEYETGLLSNFYGMLGATLALGVAMLIAGFAAYKIGKKQDGAQLKELEAKRNEELDNRILEIHGFLPVADADKDNK